MTVYIIFNVAGSDTGPFNLYSDVDGYSSPFESSVTKADLLAGYISTSVPLGTTVIRAVSFGTCTNYLDMPIQSTTTSTSSSSSTTTTSTTTICHVLLVDVTNEDLDDATGNSAFPDNTLFVAYNDCDGGLRIDTYTEADVSAPTSACWNGTETEVYYYKNDVQTEASSSNAYDAGECP